jgi:hypothetical protein
MDDVPLGAGACLVLVVQPGRFGASVPVATWLTPVRFGLFIIIIIV